MFCGKRLLKPRMALSGNCPRYSYWRSLGAFLALAREMLFISMLVYRLTKYPASSIIPPHVIPTHVSNT